MVPAVGTSRSPLPSPPTMRQLFTSVTTVTLGFCVVPLVELALLNAHEPADGVNDITDG